MDLEKSIRTGRLLDIYFNLLTEHQKKIMSMYFFDDLSLSEIAIMQGITKQAVADMIRRTEALLEKTEKKLLLFDKELKVKDYLLSKNINDKVINEMLDILYKN